MNNVKCAKCGEDNIAKAKYCSTCGYTVKKYIEPGIINNVKTSNDLKVYRDNKTTMIYNYRDKNGVFVLKLSVTPDMYE